MHNGHPTVNGAICPVTLSVVAAAVGALAVVILRIRTISRARRINSARRHPKK